MTTTTSTFRALAAVLAVSAAAYGVAANAQTTETDPASKPGVVEKTKELGHEAASATKRGAKKVGDATSNAASKSAAAVRHTGERIGSKLPPAPRDEGLNAQGQPRTPAN
ncbi:hypothetical protein [Xylophilus sp. ASV27]|uniref:hypothetical protein n=1 Tax=Xylophilus sp. ASV27 TaxID=2795129 RepID=UPI0018EC6480|nr:hypothetical protein [Xylophilus sp. ASV27]